jgi:hypothetical protein
MEETFYKFPKTPHISGSSTVDDDEVLSDLEVHYFSNLHFSQILGG